MKNKIIIILMFALFFSLGMLVQNVIQEDKTVFIIKDRHLQGLRTDDSFGFEGDWIHINVENMTYERMVEVCQHESAHEIWAEICEKDDELCKKGQELLNEYAK